MENEQVSHFRILRLLARGGMGEVYEAEDLHLGRRVAVKFVAPELAADAESLKRFEREAVAAGALTHPHIATLHTFDPRHRPPFIVMELLSGETLRSRIAAGPLPIEQAVAIGRDVAEALAFAHRREVVHRDIKPENLMFDEHGTVKVTDFGLARLARSSMVTADGSMLGTATYMAPEGVRGESAAPADVFALGIVLFEMLAGLPPFTGEGPLGTLYAIANQEAPSLRARRVEIPEALERLVNAMLAKDPEARPAAAQVAAALAGGAPTFRVAPATAATEQPPGARSAPTSAATVQTETPPTGGSRAAIPRPARPRRAAVIVGGLAVVILGAYALLYLPERSRRREAAVGLNNQGIEALGRGELARATALFEQALRRDPGSGRALLNLGIVSLEVGRGAHAESLFRLVLRRHRKDAGLAAAAHYNMGTLDLDAAAVESAVENLAASFALDSASARVYNNYGLALVRAGRPHDALPVLRRGIARFPAVAPLQKNTGLALLELGRPVEAIAYLDRALVLDSTLVEARMLRARALGR